MKRLFKAEKLLLTALILFVVFALALSLDQLALSRKLVRLHVIANSDTAEDQTLKLEVRDAVLDYVSSLEEDSVECVARNLEGIETTALMKVRESGCDYPVAVLLGDERYDTRRYGEFSLPPGEYNSLRVVIGDGDGQNWWCVLFPPLCFATAEEFETSAEAAGLSEDEISLITGKDDGYVVRFKCVELFEKLVDFFRSK
ncbi:MAG: stage II sporulation protein R [Oscillospiraceae bacterium]|jgi:stage II sporulation protein R|nr:stage II sporulation protein R [Oscillospiraceae bacterium]